MELSPKSLLHFDDSGVFPKAQCPISIHAGPAEDHQDPEFMAPEEVLSLLRFATAWVCFVTAKGEAGIRSKDQSRHDATEWLSQTLLSKIVYHHPEKH
jgi:hypothetical protein